MHYTPIGSVSLPLSDEIMHRFKSAIADGLVFCVLNLKRCKECETRMHKPLVPLAESLTYQISSNSMTGISEEEEQVCLRSKK